MKTIRIPQGNAFDLVVPLILAGGEHIDAALLTDLEVIVRQSHGAQVAASITASEDTAVISFADLLALGSYDCLITGKYDSRNIALPLNNVFAICEYSNDATFAERVVGNTITTEPQPLVGWYNTDAELEQLKTQYRNAKNAADAEKALYEQKVAEIENVAQQGDNPDATNTAILTAIGNISIDTTTIAKQGNNPNTDLSQVASDVTDLGTALNQAAVILAKQGSNVEATLSDTQTAAQNAAAAVKDGNDTAVGVAKEIRSEVGTGSDTAAETGTLFAVVKWVKDKVKSIFNLIGSPASGQPATLFAAIAAGGGGGGGDAQESTSQAILAEIGSAGSGQSPTLFGAIGDVALSATTLQSLADSWAAMVTNRNTISGYTFTDELLTSSASDIISRYNLLLSVNDSNITTVSASYFLYNCTNLINISLPNLEKITATYFLNGCTGLTSVYFPKLKTLPGANAYVFHGCTNLREISLPEFDSALPNYFLSNAPYLERLYLPKATNLNYTNSLQTCPNLIEVVALGTITSNANVSSWRPTNALSPTSTSLVYEGETFSSNLEKFLYNVRTKFAPNLPDRTGLSTLTITFNANVKAAINGDTTTALSITSKNYTIA